MMSFEKEIKEMDLKELLEKIQIYLAANIDSIYEKANSLIGVGIIHNLGTQKEKLKGQIEIYLKEVVQNIIYKIENMLVPNYYDYDRILKMLREAIE